MASSMLKATRIPGDIERILIGTDEIEARVTGLAAEISADYARSDSLVIVGVLKGAFMFMADLTRRLSVRHVVEFIALSSYSNGVESHGAVRLIMDTRVNVTGRDVLIIEDIVDTGFTLEYLLRAFRARQPASLRSCVLLSKPERRQVDVPIEYVGFTIPDEWLVGYGLDYADRFRTLPYIAVLRPKVYSHGKE